jgi:hypothetical protein
MKAFIKIPGTMDALSIQTNDDLTADVDFHRYKDVDGLRVPLEQLREYRNGLNAVILTLEHREKNPAQAEPQD